MHVINARNVADAWAQARTLMTEHGVRENSRNGPVIVVPTPVATVYTEPRERVLLDPVRDCNPFFHFFESLWMLDGRDDGAFLDNFVSDFSSRYAEPDGRVHGAYGARWRWHFSRLDQLAECVRLLREDRGTRQAVIQMWDPCVDLGVPGLRDRPCNQSVMLRVRDRVERGESSIDGEPVEVSCNTVLDVTVTCRSNDIVWGCYGANAVHFSVMHEYLAAMIGVDVGAYVQISNNWHVYESATGKMDLVAAGHNALRDYPGYAPLVDDPQSFDEELRDYLDDPAAPGPYDNALFSGVARPLWLANVARRAGSLKSALARAREVTAPDWRAAACEWLQRRVDRRS